MDVLSGVIMGRVFLDLSDDVIRRLDSLKQQRNLPRAELLREAVEQYLEKQNTTSVRNALGLWRGKGEDGLECERKMREEWSL